MKYYIESWKRWCDFKGRSSREAFWISHLFDIVFLFILVIFGVIFEVIFLIIIGVTLGGSPGQLFDVSRLGAPLLLLGFYVSLLVCGYFFTRLLPFIALSIRRLHDTNRSGWWLLMILLPIGQIILLIYYLEDSDIDENKYGKNPKE